MRESLRKSTTLLVVFGACCCALFLTPLSRAHVQTATINIVNNSSREIRHVYIAHVNADDWSADQLNNSTIQPNQSRSINVSCDQAEVKVIGEDQDGCFLTGVVACGSATWTISNETAADCGGN